MALTDRVVARYRFDAIGLLSRWGWMGASERRHVPRRRVLPRSIVGDSIAIGSSVETEKSSGSLRPWSGYNALMHEFVERHKADWVVE